LTTLVKAAQLPLAGVVRYPGLVQFDVFFNHGRLLERFYRARPWPGRTVVYRAQDNPDDETAWAALLPGSHTVLDVACEHFSILREPHVEKISKDIQTEIDNILAASPSSSPPSPASSSPAPAPPAPRQHGPGPAHVLP
jgi:hypothetical protein